MGFAWIRAHLLGRPLASLGLVAVLSLIGLLVGTALAWQRGLDRVAQAGAQADLIYLMARGSEDAAERSVIDPTAIDALRAQLAVPISAELVHMGLIDGAAARATWRGIETDTAEVRNSVQLAAGRWPAADDEVLLGDRLRRELGLDPGDGIGLLGHDLRVVGLLPAELGFSGDEIWLPRTTLQRLTGRSGASLLAVREGAQQAVMAVLMRPDLGLIDRSETDYLAAFAARLAPLRLVAWLVGGLLMLAALAGALCAAVAKADAGKATLATLRSLGVAPGRLAAWLLGEHLLLATAAFALVLLGLLALDGTVLRLGGIAPVLAIDAPIHQAAAAAMLLATVIFAAPAMAWLLFRPLARQLQHA
jgi:hypothetical protein